MPKLKTPTSDTKPQGADTQGDKDIHPVDLHVGGRIRRRRKTLRLSQEALGDRIGLSFQQVQKYERGTNRISASKLYEVARVLKIPVSHFFEGLADFECEPGDATGSDYMATSEGAQLAEVFRRIDSAETRQSLVVIASKLASGE